MARVVLLLTSLLPSFVGADNTTCATNSCDDGIECCQLSDHFECCTHGNCIPNVGCRCREELEAAAKDNATCKASSCDDGIECCQLSDSFECCTGGESCIPNVGCRCREELEAELNDATCTANSCADGVECCQLSDHFECCTQGNCIPNVGCRCREGEPCLSAEAEAKDNATCTANSCDEGVECCQLSDHFECCTHGNCIPNVGCRCREELELEAKDDATCTANSCADGVECCQLSDHFECCTQGNCIPNVGCRCREGEPCLSLEAEAKDDATCTSNSCADGVECCQLSDHFECCTEGNCIPNVGCRCREGEPCLSNANLMV